MALKGELRNTTKEFLKSSTLFRNPIVRVTSSYIPFLTPTLIVVLAQTPLSPPTHILTPTLIHCREASSDLLDMIVAGSEHAFFKEGESVLEEDDEKMALYIVQDGMLELRNSSNNYIGFVGPGEICGEMALVFGHRGTEVMKAVRPTTVLALDRATFALILGNFPNERDKILGIAEKRLFDMGVDLAGSWKGLLTSRN